MGRWTTHRCQLRKGNHHCTYLQRAWNKYGEAAFRFAVLQSCREAELEATEQKWMDATPAGKLFNLQPFARSCRGYKATAATREKIAAAARRIGADPDERRRRSDRAKVQHAEGRIGKRGYTVLARQCKDCGSEFVPGRAPTGVLKQSKYCSNCRPKEHRGGNYRERALWGEGRPKQLYRGGK